MACSNQRREPVRSWPTRETRRSARSRCGDWCVRPSWSCLLSLGIKAGCCGYKDVIAVRPECFDRGEFGKSSLGPATDEHGNQVDRLHDEGARYGDDGFLDELLQPTQRAERRPGMNSADPAGVPSAPRL